MPAEAVDSRFPPLFHRPESVPPGNDITISDDKVSSPLYDGRDWQNIVGDGFGYTSKRQ